MGRKCTGPNANVCSGGMMPSTVAPGGTEKGMSDTIASPSSPALPSLGFVQPSGMRCAAMGSALGLYTSTIMLAHVLRCTSPKSTTLAPSSESPSGRWSRGLASEALSEALRLPARSVCSTAVVFIPPPSPSDVSHHAVSASNAAVSAKVIMLPAAPVTATAKVSFTSVPTTSPLRVLESGLPSPTSSTRSATWVATLGLSTGLASPTCRRLSSVCVATTLTSLG
mmetsp:Transcript_13178/g.41185  ORF Transcript_13178/g.41185 Transcript_13178/m.41185 type:complete len:225 (+) Transcript_13178:2644-3318(+)